MDYLIFPARCNQGLAYYDTKTGIRHPSLEYDLFGRLSGACAERGIALTAYFNVGISSEEGLRHRDWTTLCFDGRELREPRLTPFVRTMCYNTGYRDHLIEMVKEVVRNYPVAGLMLDCLKSFPCVCPVCVGEMKEQGIDCSDEDAVTMFAEASAIRLARDIARETKKINPDLLISCNYPPPEKLKEINDYYDVISLPASEGYESMPVTVHYVRTLDKPVINMTGRFYDWGDFGGLLPREAIRSQLLYGLANGMRPNIGGHFHPAGDREDAVLDRIEDIYADLQTREEWYDGATPLADVAVVYPEVVRHPGGDDSLRGAVRMLDELHVQFDVVSRIPDRSKYKVLIFPDGVAFDDETARRVKKHLEEGGAVISTGASGLNVSKTAFALEEEWGVKFLGECALDPAYVDVGDKFGEGLPRMSLSLYSSGIDTEPLPGTEVEARLVKPYQNRGWDGEYAVTYNPPKEATATPALTVNGNVAHFSHLIFSGYHERASVELRRLFENVLDALHPQPVLKTGNLPPFARAFVTEQSGRRMVHLLSYIPEQRGKSHIIEEGIALTDIRLMLRDKHGSIKKVYTAPQREPLPFNHSGGYVEVTVPESRGYSLIVFEEQ